MQKRVAQTRITQLWPLLDVRNLERSLAFWRDKLGFTLVAHDGAPNRQMSWCRVERDGASIMLQGGRDDKHPTAPRGSGICLYFVCDDADAIYAELSGRGVTLAAPKVAYYGMKQLYVPEPDGYAICFESPAPPPAV